MSSVSASCFFPPSLSDSRLAELPQACCAELWRRKLRGREPLRALEHESTYQTLSVPAQRNPWVWEHLWLPLWPAEIEWAGNGSDDSKHCGTYQVPWDHEKGFSFPLFQCWHHSCLVVTRTGPCAATEVEQGQSYKGQYLGSNFHPSPAI